MRRSDLGDISITDTVTCHLATRSMLWQRETDQYSIHFNDSYGCIRVKDDLIINATYPDTDHTMFLQVEICE
jgi:hypothetical protein